MRRGGLAVQQSRSRENQRARAHGRDVAPALVRLSQRFGQSFIPQQRACALPARDEQHVGLPELRLPSVRKYP